MAAKLADSSGRRYQVGTYREIPDYDDPTATLLRRWKLIECPAFGLYVHHLVKSDSLNRPPHDHPWSFVSIGLRGRYTEARMELQPNVARYGGKHWEPMVWVTRWDKSGGRFRFRRATDLHRVILDDEDRGAWTVVLRGPRRRVWGFQGPGGWVAHTEADNPRQRQGGR